MAIEALSQESSEDVISRQAAIDAMETWDKFGCDPDGKLVRYDDDKHYIPYVHYEDMVHAIKHLPSIQPEQLTDTEQRIFLAAMSREEKVCKKVDEECEISLVHICHEIIRKVKDVLWA